MKRREMSVAGSFYPSRCIEIEDTIASFNAAPEGVQAPDFSPRALISPHAGYVYSGFTANAAYRLIDTTAIKRVIIIGPSHRVYLRGASVALHETYSSPCKEFEIDREYSQTLLRRYAVLRFEPSAHSEHSTETQVPFVGHYFKTVSLVEIVYGEIDYNDLVPIIADALQDKESFVIISTDLSHFYTLKEANLLDAVCLKAVGEMNMKKFDSGCEACGMTGIKALISAAKKLNMKSMVIDYRTSFDTSSDASRVVGYMSALIG